VDLSSWASGDFELSQAQVAPSVLPEGRVRVRDSFYTAPGYREIGMFYSCVPDAAYPWDPKVMREILQLAPDAIPMWVQWVFLSPQETGNPEIVVFGRHALGRHIVNHVGYLEPFRVLMPTMPCQGLRFERPNDIWFIHQGPMGQHPKYKDLPGDYLPFDSDLVSKVADIAQGFKMSDKEYRAYLQEILINKPIRDEEQRLAHIASEHEYARKQIMPFVDRQYNNVSEKEALDFYRGRGVREPEKKPFVTVGPTPS
jgi:hypothetical protein